MNSSQKKLLILGAMASHVPLLKRAKERGIYTITCDYIPDAVGHSHADEAHLDSTTDFEAVLKLAKACKIDAIMTFNSDPAALTAAYVSEQLGLPGNPFEAVQIMAEKDKFRQFLASHAFNTPRFKQYTNYLTLSQDLDYFKFPVIIKPVDSSGSKGISKVASAQELQPLFERALDNSRSKRVIVEEFITANGRQIHGDAFVDKGKIKFIYLGDHHFDNKINDLVPISSTFPSQHSKETIRLVENEVQRFISKVGFKQGGINIEARIDDEGKAYLIEVGPRNGGNFIPIVLQHASGFNFIDANLDAYLGLDFKEQEVRKEGFVSHLIPHSKAQGTLDSLVINPELASKIIERHDAILPGEQVNTFIGSNAAISILIIRYNSAEEMDYYVSHCEEMCQVTLKHSHQAPQQ